MVVNSSGSIESDQLLLYELDRQSNFPVLSDQFTACSFHEFLSQPKLVSVIRLFSSPSTLFALFSRSLSFGNDTSHLEAFTSTTFPLNISSANSTTAGI